MEIIKLKENVKIIGGSTPSTKDKKLWNGNINWYALDDLKNNRSSTSKKITNQRKLVNDGTLLFSVRAPIGYIGWSVGSSWFSQGIKAFITNEDKIKKEYLFHWLKINTNLIKSIAIGSTFKEVSKATLENLKISLPAVKKQQEIIDIIKPLEKKIVILKGMNEKVFHYLKLSSLEHKYNETAKIKDLFLFKNTKSHNAFDLKLSTTNLKNNFKGIDLSKEQNFVAHNIFQKNDILISTIRTYFKKMWFSNDSGGYGASILKLSGLDRNKMLLYFFHFMNNWNFYTKDQIGTTMPTLNKNSFKNKEVPLFENGFSKKEMNLYNKYEINTLLIEKLKNNVDLLIKKLII